MRCEICDETEIEDEIGALQTSAYCEASGEEAILTSLRHSSRRNYILCESCNKIVCHNCCENPRSGYCDVCIERYSLHEYLIEVGLFDQ